MDWSSWGHLFLKSLTCLSLCWQFSLWCGCIYPFVKSSLASASSISYFNANYILDIHQRLCHSWYWTVQTKCQYSFTLQIRLDQFTSGRSKTKKLPRPKSHNRQLRSPLYLNPFSIKQIIYRFFFLVLFLYLSKTDSKAATFHKSPRVPASCRAELITIVYNPIPGSHSGSFFYLPWKVKLTFFSSL